MNRRRKAAIFLDPNLHDRGGYGKLPMSNGEKGEWFRSAAAGAASDSEAASGAFDREAKARITFVRARPKHIVKTHSTQMNIAMSPMGIKRRASSSRVTTGAP